MRAKEKKMRQKTLMLFLILALMVSGSTSLLAQDAASLPADEAASQPIYLPLVRGSQAASPSSEAEPAEGPEMTEEDLTDGGDGVQAAGGGNRGLVFVSTNAMDEVRGNEVVMYRRGADGQLILTGRFPTGGQGLGSSLSSQGAVVLSNNGRWLFVVNAGSNELSVFAVHAAGLVLTDKVASGGQRPTSVTVRKNLVFVLNAGDPGNITGFKLNREGKLAPLPDGTRPLSNGGVGAAPAPAQVSFTPDGDALVVTERATNLIDTYKVHKQGRITGPYVQNAAGVTPFGFAFAQKETLVVSEAFAGEANASAVSSYAVDDEELHLVSASVPTGETAACWIAIAGDGRFAYSTNAGSASISAYAVGEDGALTLLNGRAGLTGEGTGPTDVMVSRDGAWLYALSPRSHTIVGFAVQADGSLAPLGSFGGLTGTPVGLAAW
jgi:6-phosphogluconolactonase